MIFQSVPEEVEEKVTNNDEPEEEVELPPPMKPISESLRVSNENNQLQVCLMKMGFFFF